MIYQQLVYHCIATATMSDIGKTPFYAIERAIKMYRQFAQRRLVAAGSSITVDQWLVLNAIETEPGIQQGTVAEMVFKDKASIARMIDLLVEARMVTRTIPKEDRRSVSLALTKKGAKQLTMIGSVVKDYRSKALKGVSAKEVAALKATLDKIMTNCDE